MSFDAANFGRRVGSARVWRGLKPKELAQKLGMSTEAINAMERGDRKEPPAKLLLEALAKELDQPVEWLESGTEPPWRKSARVDDEVMRLLADARAALEEVEDAARRATDAAEPRPRAASE